MTKANHCPDRLPGGLSFAGRLAEKIDSDGRQVSRYENGRITPSLDALVRIAETFNVSVDYLVVADPHRRPLHSAKNCSVTSSPTSPRSTPTTKPPCSKSSTPSS